MNKIMNENDEISELIQSLSKLDGDEFITACVKITNKIFKDKFILLDDEQDNRLKMWASLPYALKKKRYRLISERLASFGITDMSDRSWQTEENWNNFFKLPLEKVNTSL
jgi:hypothetical protein